MICQDGRHNVEIDDSLGHFYADLTKFLTQNRRQLRKKVSSSTGEKLESEPYLWSAKINSNAFVVMRQSPAVRIRDAGHQELKSPRSGNSSESNDGHFEFPLAAKSDSAFRNQGWNAAVPGCSARSKI
jgi:hypothetical protein